MNENAKPSLTQPPLFRIGVLLFLAAPAGYALQLWAARLFTPWYAPVLTTLGVGFMAASVWQRFGIGRAIGLTLFSVICLFGWFMVLVGTNTPEYTGPAQIGQKIPAYATKLADGTPFTDKDLATGQRSVVIFFRGRW